PSPPRRTISPPAPRVERPEPRNAKTSVMLRSLIHRPPSWLVSLCCLLALLSAGSPTVLVSLGAGVWGSVEPLTSDRPATEEDDDEDEAVVKIHSSNFARVGRATRAPRGQVASGAWRAHLPHTHTPTPGFSLPSCTPFERGAHLPLRC